MNCVKLVLAAIKKEPEKIAIQMIRGDKASFRELEVIARKTQALLLEKGVQKGDHVLLFIPLSPMLYGTIIGLAAMGVSIVLVEPWMPVAKINRLIGKIRPKAFITGSLGMLWGMRSQGVRNIPLWLKERSIDQMIGINDLKIEEQLDEAPAIITFTTGTTGEPKGMIRSHSYLADQHRILSASLGSELGPDLCIFANFALGNLASGRTSIIVTPKWKVKDLNALDSLPDDLAPQSLTCGPGFLLKLMKHANVPSLKSIHVGGALTDCWIFEHAFDKWPSTHFTHLYGSTEVEPVALVDAKLAVKKSREAGFFQTVFLGKPIESIKSRIEADTVWVSGPHVCPKYLYNPSENHKNKHTDHDGQVWHRMGDRIKQDEGFWWYRGRSGQAEESFMNEQYLYKAIGSSAGFLNEEGGIPIYYGQNASLQKDVIQRAIPRITKVMSINIKRDPRHKARIDRVASMNARHWIGGIL
ncbi:MAG: AMP-binding protein [Oligoflexales bacterium]